MNGIIIFPYTSEFITNSNLQNILYDGINFFIEERNYIEQSGYNFRTLLSFLESQLPNNYFIITTLSKLHMVHINYYTYIFVKLNNVIYYLSNYSRMDSFIPIDDHIKNITFNATFTIYQNRYERNLFFKVGKDNKKYTQAHGAGAFRGQQGGGGGAYDRQGGDINPYLRELHVINEIQNLDVRMQNLDQFKRNYRSKFNEPKILEAYENSIKRNLSALLQRIKSIPNLELRNKQLSKFEIKYKSRLDKPKYDSLKTKLNEIKKLSVYNQDSRQQQQIINLLDELESLKYIFDFNYKKEKLKEFRKKYETKLKDTKYEKVLKKYNKTVLDFNRQKREFYDSQDHQSKRTQDGGAQGGGAQKRAYNRDAYDSQDRQKIQKLKHVKNLIQINKNPRPGGQAYENLVKQSREIDSNLLQIYQNYNDLFEFERLHRYSTIKEMFPNRRAPQILLNKYLKDYIPPFTTIMRENVLTVPTARSSTATDFFKNNLFPYCDRIIEKWNQQTGRQLPKWQKNL